MPLSRCVSGGVRMLSVRYVHAVCVSGCVDGCWGAPPLPPLPRCLVVALALLSIKFPHFFTYPQQGIPKKVKKILVMPCVSSLYTHSLTQLSLTHTLSLSHTHIRSSVTPSPSLFLSSPPLSLSLSLSLSFSLSVHICMALSSSLSIFFF